MASINKTFILGNLGKDPELRSVGETVACNFSVATTEKWTAKNGEKKEDTQWHRVTAWGKTAELCAQYLTKGSPVHVEGKLKYSTYEKDGVTKYSTDITAERVTFLGGKRDSAADASSGGFPMAVAESDDLPF